MCCSYLQWTLFSAPAKIMFAHTGIGASFNLKMWSRKSKLVHFEAFQVSKSSLYWAIEVKAKFLVFKFLSLSHWSLNGWSTIVNNIVYISHFLFSSEANKSFYHQLAAYNIQKTKDLVLKAHKVSPTHY